MRHLWRTLRRLRIRMLPNLVHLLGHISRHKLLLLRYLFRQFREVESGVLLAHCEPLMLNLGCILGLVVVVHFRVQVASDHSTLV
jgi:hypothetical protein